MLATLLGQNDSMPAPLPPRTARRTVTRRSPRNMLGPVSSTFNPARHALRTNSRFELSFKHSKDMRRGEHIEFTTIIALSCPSGVADIPLLPRPPPRSCPASLRPSPQPGLVTAGYHDGTTDCVRRAGMHAIISLKDASTELTSNEAR